MLDKKIDEYIIVQLKETSEIVCLESEKLFNGNVHNRYPNALESTEESKIRFTELKAKKAWLNPELKDEYQELKAICG